MIMRNYGLNGSPVNDTDVCEETEIQFKMRNLLSLLQAHIKG